MGNLFGLRNGKRAGAVIIGLLLVMMTSDAHKINTDGWTDSPYLTPDGRYLYFTYTPYNFMPYLLGTGDIDRRGPDRPGHHDNPDGNPWGDTDIYRIERFEDGTWGNLVNMPFNDEGADACPILTADGKGMYWQKDIGTADIYVAYQDEAGEWGEDINLGLPVNRPDSDELNPHISSDEQTLYFTSDRAGGYGGLDLYVSYREADGEWSTPENMGEPINTAEDEDQLWVSEDGQVAYFNRGLVIHTMQREGKGWSTPEAIAFEDGPILAGEASLTSDGERMVFAVPDIKNERLVISESVLLEDGRWSIPQPLD